MRSFFEIGCFYTDTELTGYLKRRIYEARLRFYRHVLCFVQLRHSPGEFERGRNRAFVNVLLSTKAI